MNDFIPIQPFAKYCFNTDELNIERLVCSTKLKTILQKDKMNKIFYCPRDCKSSNSQSSSKTNLKKIINSKRDSKLLSKKDLNTNICDQAVREKIITNKGGQFTISKYNNSNSNNENYLNNINDERYKIKSLDYNLVGLNFMITEIKLGYIEDLSKNTVEANNILTKNYIIKINKENKNYESHSDSSFVFYKKNIVDNDEYVLIDVKLVCDDQSNTFKNPFENKEDSLTIYKIEKLHDMINGFTLWTKKIKYSELISDKNNEFTYVDDLSVKFIYLKNDKPTLSQDKIERLVYNLSSSKFICKMPKHLVLLKVKYKKAEDISNLPDIHSDCSTKFSQVYNFKSKYNHSKEVMFAFINIISSW